MSPLVLPAALEDAKSSETVNTAEKETILSRIALKGQEGTSPRIALAIPQSVRYTLTRTAPSEYVTTLFDVRPSADLVKQTIFSSSKSTAIRSVRAAKNGQDTLVRIFTQPTSYLTSRRDGDSLIIEESHDLSKIAKDIRAQISPAAANQKGNDDSSKKNIKKAVSNKPTKGQVDLKKRLKSQKKEVKPGVTKNDTTSELAAIRGDSATYTGRLISLDLQDADIDSALRIIAEVSNLNIVAGDGVSGKVTLKLVDVPWDQALEVILKSHGLDKVLQGNVLRVAPVDKLKAERESFKEARVAEEELEPLSVKYMRVSYAKASEITALVETVLTERGTVAFDERSNQLVVKDVAKGLKNVSELVTKIDLRTPQILLETQIVEASRSLSRELGSELGFQYIQSPATGNGTGLNFPSAVSVGGSADPTGGGITGSAFPIASSATLGSAITMLFDSADGTKSLSARLSQLEQEGEVRIISKPAVATTNNKPAEIKSVEKFRVKLPNGGLSIATGSGAQSAGSGDSATQTIEAGIVLNVTPQASPDYYILLDIKAKSSSFGAKAVDGIPNEIERSASSSVLVSSGQTFALGGIYKITEQDRVAGVPFFKDIPVLGTFFRSLTTENSDEELLFFITPRIVEGSFEDASMKMVS
jgi:type IV pilus secretin PilQ/predicted competence protein